MMSSTCDGFHIFDPSTLETPLRVSMDSSNPFCSYSRNCRMISAASTHGLFVLDAYSKAQLRQLMADQPYLCACFSPDHRLLAAVSTSPFFLYVWRVSDWELLVDRKPLNFECLSAKFTPDSRTLVITCREGQALLLDASNGSFEQCSVVRTTLLQLPDTVTCSVCVPATRILPDKAQLSDVSAQEGETECNTQSLGGYKTARKQMLLALASDFYSKCHIFDITNSHDPILLTGLRCDQPVTNCLFSPDGALLATCHAISGFSLWDVSTRRAVLHVKTYASMLAFHPRRSGVLVTAGLNRLSFWSAREDDVAAAAARDGDTDAITTYVSV